VTKENQSLDSRFGCVRFECKSNKHFLNAVFACLA